MNSFRNFAQRVLFIKHSEKSQPIFSVGLVLKGTKFVKLGRRAFDMGNLYHLRRMV